MMSAPWDQIRRARDKLAEQFLHYPDVNLIDIGYAGEGGQHSGQIVLRIHVKAQWLKTSEEKRIAFPEQVDGIPVMVLVADYQPERDTPIKGQNGSDFG